MEYLAKTDKTIKEHREDLENVMLLLMKYGYLKDEHLIKMVHKACIHHDDGKVNPKFQERIKNGGKFDSENELPHNVLSGFLLSREEFENDEEYITVLFAILYHHDYGDPYEIISTKKELAYSLLQDFSYTEINHRLLNDVVKHAETMNSIKVKGFLHKCDYSASGKYTAEYPNDFLEESMENIKTKWKKNNPDSDWNSLQKFAINKRSENIIMIAQTGMGKTEAGLQWIGNNKGYFVLPLRTAINAIYERIKNEILLNEKVDYCLSILHSGSLEYYSQNTDVEEPDLIEYEKRGKHLSIPLNISTMDQLFDFIFKYQGYELKLTTLSYSKIVIDEIQMYDPEMLAYLIFGLKKIVEAGGKVAVMTATLSPFLKDLLIKEINFKEENIGIFTNEIIRHNITTFDASLEADSVFSLYKNNEARGISNKILVVCNTIKKAQKLYEELADKVDKSRLFILHSQFIRRERSEKENAIIEFGRTYDENGNIDVNEGIWISTSLVEASLDIDFDYLITELQDLNSLFQRMGRCNRRGVKNTDIPNCYIYLSNSNSYIDKTIFKLSKKALEGYEGKITEKEKMELINSVMTMENLKRSDYYMGKSGYKQTMKSLDSIELYKYKKGEKKLRNILSVSVIPYRIYELHEDEIRENEKAIKDEISYLDAIKAKRNILQYSVDIPYYKWVNYEKKRYQGKVICSDWVSIGIHEKIEIMECQYDEKGFQELDYEHIVREPVLL